MTLQLQADPMQWIRLDRVDSTNSYLLREDLASGTVVIAKEQTAGRGSHGRTWISLEDSLIFSGLLVFSSDAIADERLSLLSLLVGVAVLRAAQSFLPSAEFRIKEPNDVLIVRGGKTGKIAGILVESEIRSAQRRVVVGVGVNGTKAPAVSDSVYQPLALFDDDRAFDGSEFARRLILEFNARLSQMWSSPMPAFLGEVAQYRIAEGG